MNSRKINYASTIYKEMQVGVAFGSSSEYSHIYLNNNEKEKLTSDDLNKAKNTNIENDDVYISVIDKFKSSDSKHTYFQRGGALIGLQINPKLDKATKLFVNWLYNQSNGDLTNNIKNHMFEYQTSDKKITKKSPAEFYVPKCKDVPGNNDF